MQTPEQVKASLEDLHRAALFEEGAFNGALLSQTGLFNVVAALEKEAAILTSVEAALGELSQRVVGQSVGPIDALVTKGLQLVFDDQRLVFRTRVEKARGKTSVRFVLLQDGQEAPILDSYGGGVVVVAGVLIRIVTIMALQARRVLLLDETLAHVSRRYVPALSKMLRELCDSLDFTILMVTHTEEFAEHATTHYRTVGDTPTGTTFVKSSA